MHSVLPERRDRIEQVHDGSNGPASGRCQQRGAERGGETGAEDVSSPGRGMVFQNDTPDNAQVFLGR